MSRGARCSWVGCRPCALEGGAGGGARRPLWFEHGGGHLRGVGLHVGGGCSRGRWAFAWEVGIRVGGGRSHGVGVHLGGGIRMEGGWWAFA